MSQQCNCCKYEPPGCFAFLFYVIIFLTCCAVSKMQNDIKDIKKALNIKDTVESKEEIKEK